MSYYEIKDILYKRLQEPAPRLVQILTGPRQVGKTHLLLEIARKMGDSALYYPADTPQTSLPGWWDMIWGKTVSRAKKKKIILLLDEIHYLPNWSRLIKSAIDEVFRNNIPINIVLTSSSSLQLGRGAKETMAGRFESLVLKMWTPKDIAKAFSLSKKEAVEHFVRFGSFPGAFGFLSDIPRWKTYLRDSIVEPAIGRDLLALEEIRKPFLLRQIFAVCTGHPSEILSLAKIAGAITDKGTLETIGHYLNILEQAYLIAALRKYSSKELRQRASSSKVVPLSNAFLAVSSEGEPPLSQTEPTKWGRWAENACISFAIGQGQDAHYWREEPLEVDFITNGTWGKWAIEVKTGDYISKDLTGLLEFCKRHPQYRPLVICNEYTTDTAKRLGVDFVLLEDYLWNGLQGL